MIRNLSLSSLTVLVLVASGCAEEEIPADTGLEQAPAEGVRAPGDDGDVNAEGPMGPAGPEGPMGPVGPQGPVGPEGAVGEVGPMGPQGLDGAAGAAGPMGAQGPVGPQGPQGFTGATGAVGATGPVGPQGPQGAQGAQGLQGPRGLAGLDGQDGVLLGKLDIYVRGQAVSVVGGTDESVDAECDDADDLLLTGGCIAGAGTLTLIESFPDLNTSATTEAEWKCWARNDGISTQTLTARVVCVDVP